MKRQKLGRCKICGKVCSTQWHHVFGAHQRKAADREGLVIELCPGCHEKMHKDAAFWLIYKKGFQRAWETREGNTREKWMKIFHRNYLTDLEDYT